MSETTSLRRVLRKPAMRAAFGVGNTKLDDLEEAGVIPKRFPLWPGSVVVGWWEDEVIEAQRRLEEARAEEDAREVEKGRAKANHPPLPKSALRKAVRR